MNCLYNNALYWGNNGLNDFFCPQKNLIFFERAGLVFATPPQKHKPLIKRL